VAVELRWTKAALLLTVFAVILALLSLLTEYYELRVEVETDGPVPYFITYDFYLMGQETGDSLRFYDYTGFEEIGSVITITAALVVVWALFSSLYISALADGAPGFYRGWLVMALSLSPLFYYTLSISAAADSCVDGNFQSGISPSYRGTFRCFLGGFRSERSFARTLGQETSEPDEIDSQVHLSPSSRV
jgi:hypothetical protein